MSDPDEFLSTYVLVLTDMVHLENLLPMPLEYRVVNRLEQCVEEGWVKEGDVILMHDGYQSSVDAAFALVDQLQNQGFVFVNVEEMILE